MLLRVLCCAKHAVAAPGSDSVVAAVVCCAVAPQLQHLADLLPVKRSDDEFVLQVGHALPQFFTPI